MRPERRLHPREVPRLRVLLVWALLAAVLLVRALPQIAAQTFPDPDDLLRLVQVRDLLGGQAWFDLTQHRIDAPRGVPMHWSRLVDVPIALIVLGLAPLVDTGLAEQVAVVVVPLLTLGMIVFLTAWIAARWLDRECVTLACLCLGLAPVLMAQVQPMRIDHHGWQVAAALAAVAGLAVQDRARGAIVAGVAIAVGLAISLEVLPLGAVLGAVFAARWLTNGRDSTSLLGYLASLAIASIAVFAATRGPGALAQHCDQISLGHLGMFAIVAGGAALVARVHPGSRIVLAILLLLPVVVGAGYYLWSAPQCTAGPFAQLDPLVRSYWFENVAEGRPAWRLAPEQWVPVVAQALIALGALAQLWRRESGRPRQFWGEYLLVFIVMLVTGLLVWRSLAFVGALSAIPLGWLAARLLRLFGEARRAPRKAALAGGLVLALVPGFPIAVAGAVTPAAAPAGDGGTSPTQFVHHAATLGALTPATMFAPLDMGPAVLLETRHRVVATAHHRAPAAMHDVIATFIGSEAGARARIARHGAEYVVVATDLPEMRLYASEAPHGFAARLIAGKVPAWLEPVDLDLPRTIKVWRVKR